MTRQMADDEVLRVLDQWIEANDMQRPRGEQKVRMDRELEEARAAVAALQAERDGLERNLVAAMAQVAEADKEAERAESALEALHREVAELVEAADAITFDTYALTAPETRAAFDGRESVAVVRIDTLDAFRTELLAIKERMG